MGFSTTQQALCSPHLCVIERRLQNTLNIQIMKQAILFIIAISTAVTVFGQQAFTQVSLEQKKPTNHAALYCH